MLHYSRKDLKQAAKNDLSGRWGLAIGAALLAMIVPSVILSIPSSILSTMSSMMMELGDVEQGALYSALGTVFSTIFTILVLGPLSFGYYAFTLRFSRREEVTATLPYRVFTSGVFGRYALAFFMMNLFITLWSLLFLIPGIVKSYSYYLTAFLLNDHPEMGWKEAINESKRMMNGHKMELFMLHLSFLGWIILSIFTLGILLIYVVPYMQQAEANFYRALREEPIGVYPQAPDMQA
ncbi:MAG: DUF975 family protein [Firmicutes bacterium]|nr:DUF975 family protein [Bacillota bacterium]